MKFSKLILRKIIKILATRCLILGLKCTKNRFQAPSPAPDHAGGAYSAPPDPLAGFGGPTSKGKRGEGREGKGRGKKKRGGDGRGREEGGKRKKGGKGNGRTTAIPHFF